MQVATTIDGDTGMVVKRLSVPVGLEELMESLTKQVLMKKPKDLFAFASEHFAHLVAIREKLNANQQEQAAGDTKQLKVKSVTSGTKFHKLPTPIIFTNSKTPREITTPKAFRPEEKKKTRFNQQSLIKDPSPRRGVTTQKERAKWKKQPPFQKEEAAPAKRTPREIREAYTFRRDDSKQRSREKLDKNDRSDRSDRVDKKEEKSVGKLASPTKQDPAGPKTRREPTRRQQGVTPRITPRNKSTDSNSSSSISVHGKGISKSTEKLSKISKGKNVAVAKVAPIAAGAVGAVGAALAGGASRRKGSKSSKSSQEGEGHESDLKRLDSITVSESGTFSDRSDKSKSSQESKDSAKQEDPKEETVLGEEGKAEAEAEEDVESVSGSIVSNAVVGSTLSEDLEGPTEDMTDVAASELTADDDKAKDDVVDEPKLESIPEAKSTEPEVKEGATETIHEDHKQVEDDKTDVKTADSTQIKDDDVTEEDEDVKDTELVDERVKDILVLADKHEDEVKEVLLADDIPDEETSQPEETDNKEEAPMTVDGKPMTVPEEELCTVVDAEVAKEATVENKNQEEERTESKMIEESTELKHAAEVVEEQLRVLKEMEDQEEEEEKEFAEQERLSQADSDTVEDVLKEPDHVEETGDQVDVDGTKSSDAILRISQSAPNLVPSPVDGDGQDHEDEGLVTIATTPSPDDSVHPDLDISGHSAAKVDDDGPLSLEDVSKYLIQEKQKNDSPRNDEVPAVADVDVDQAERPTTSVVFGGDVEPNAQQEEEALALHVQKSADASAATKIQSAWRGHHTRKHVPKQIKKQVENTKKDVDDDGAVKGDLEMDEIAKAATVIQAFLKGHLVRKQIKLAKEDKEAKGTKKVEEPLGVVEEENEEKFAKAATLIQAFIKGHLVRKQHKVLKEKPDGGEDSTQAENDDDLYLKLSDSIDQEINEVLEKLENVSIPDDEPDIHGRRKRSLDFSVEDGDDENLKEADAEHSDEAQPELHDIQEENEEEPEVTDNQHHSSDHIAMTKSFVDNEIVASPREEAASGQHAVSEKTSSETQEESVDHIAMTRSFMETEKANYVTSPMTSPREDVTKQAGVDSETVEDATSKKEGKIAGALGAVGGFIASKTTGLKNFLSPRSKSTNKQVDEEEEQTVVAQEDDQPSESVRISLTEDVPEQTPESTETPTVTKEPSVAESESPPEHIAATKSFVDYEKENYVESPLPTKSNNESPRENLADSVTEVATSSAASKNDGKIIDGAVGSVGGFIASQTNNLRTLISSGSKTLEEAKETFSKDVTTVFVDDEETTVDPLASRFAKLRSGFDDIVDSAKENVDERKNDVSEMKEKVSEDIKDAQEDFKENVDQVLEASENALKTVEDKVKAEGKDIEEKADDLEASTKNIQEEVSHLKSEVTATITGAQEDIKDNLKDISNKVNEEVDASGASEGIKKIGEEVETMTNVVHEIKESATGAQNDIKDNLKNVVDTINEKHKSTTEEIEKMGDKIDEDINEVKKDITETITEAENDIKDNLKDISDKVNEEVDSASEGIEKVGEQVDQTMSDIVNDVDETVTGADNDIQDNLKVISDKANEQVESTAKGIEEIGDKIDQTLSDVVPDAKNEVTETKNNITEGITEVVDNLKDDASQLKTELDDTIAGAEDDIKDNVEDVSNEVKRSKRGIEEAIDDLKEDVTELKEDVEDVVVKEKEDLKDNINDTKEGVKDAVDAEVIIASDAISEAATALDENVSNTITEVKDAVENTRVNITDKVDETQGVIVHEVENHGEAVTELQEDDDKVVTKAEEDLSKKLDENEKYEQLHDVADDLKEESKDLVDKVEDTISQTHGDIKDHMQETSGDIIDKIDSAPDKISEEIDVVDTAISDAIQGATEKVEKAEHDISDNLEDIADKAEETTEEISKNIDNLKEAIKEHVETSDVPKNSEEIMDKLTSAPDKISEKIGDTNIAISNAVAEASEKVKNAEDGISDNLEDIAVKVEESSKNISKNVNNIKEETSHIPKNSEEIIEKITSGPDKPSEKIGDIDIAISDSVVKATEEVNKAESNIADNLEDIAGKIEESTEEIRIDVDNLKEEIKEAVETSHMPKNSEDIMNKITLEPDKISEKIGNIDIAISEAMAGVTEEVKRAKDDISDNLEDIADKVQELDEKVSKNVDNLTEEIKEAVETSHIPKNSEEIMDKIISAPDKLNDELSEIDTITSGAVAETSEKVNKGKDDIKKNLEDIAGKVEELNEEISKNADVADNMKNELRDNITTSEEEIKEHIQKEKVPEVVASAITEERNIISAVEDGIKDKLEDISKDIPEIREDLCSSADSLKHDVTEIKEQLKDAVTNAEEDIKSVEEKTSELERVTSDAVSDVNATVVKIEEDIKDAADDATQKLEETEDNVNKSIETLKKQGSDLVDQGHETISQVREDIQNNIKVISDHVDDTADQLKEDILNTITDVDNNGKEAKDEIKENVNDLVIDVTETVDKVEEDIENIVHQTTQALSDDVSDIKYKTTEEITNDVVGTSKRGKRNITAVLQDKVEQVDEDVVSETVINEKNNLKDHIGAKIVDKVDNIAEKLHQTKDTIKENVTNIDPEEVIEVMDETADDIEKVTDLLNGEKEAPAEVVADIIETTGKITEELGESKAELTNAQDSKDSGDSTHVVTSSKTLQSPSFEETIQDFKDAIRHEIDDMVDTDQSESPENQHQPDSLERIAPSAPPLADIAPGTATSIEEEEPPEVMNREPIVELADSDDEEGHEPHVDILIIDEEYNSPVEIFEEEDEAEESEHEHEHEHDVDDRDHQESRQLIHEIKEELNNIKAIIEEGDDGEVEDQHQPHAQREDGVVITEMTEEETEEPSEAKHDYNDAEVLSKDTLDVHDKANTNTMGRLISHDSSTSLDSLATVVLTEDLNKYREEKNKEHDTETNDDATADENNKTSEDIKNSDKMPDVPPSEDVNKQEEITNDKTDNNENTTTTFDENANQDDVIIIDATQLSNSNDDDIKFLAGFVNAATKIQSAFRGFRVRNHKTNKDKKHGTNDEDDEQNIDTETNNEHVNDELLTPVTGTETSDEKTDSGPLNVEEEKVSNVDAKVPEATEVIKTPEPSEKKNPTLGQFLKSLTDVPKSPLGSSTSKKDENKQQTEETSQVTSGVDVNEIVKASKDALQVDENDDDHDTDAAPVSPSAEPFFLHDPAVVKDNPIADAIKMTSEMTNQEANIGLLHSGEFHDAIPLPFEMNDLYEKSQANLKANDAQMAPNVNDVHDAKATPPAGAERPVTTSASTSLTTASVVVVAASSTSASLSATATVAAATPHPISHEHAAHSVTAALLSGDDAQHSTEQQNTNVGNAAGTEESQAREGHKEETEGARKVASTEREADISGASVDEGVAEVEATQPEGAGDAAAMDPRRNNATITERNAESQAAVKIQASFRGYQVRKQMQKPKNCNDVISPKRNARRKTSGGRAPDSKKLKDDIDIEDKSATKIQAGIRGFLVRRRNQKKRDNEED